MPKEISLSVFDYESVGREEAQELRGLMVELQNIRQDHRTVILGYGRALLTAKNLLASYGRGKFAEWVELECGFSMRSAHNYMVAYEHFGNLANFAKFEPSAMYELASNEDAKKAAIKRAECGETITLVVARQLVEDAKKRIAKKKKDPSSPEHTPRHSESLYSEEEACPACGCKWWLNKIDGAVCDECGQPIDEPVGDAEESFVDESEPGDNDLAERSADEEKAYKKARSAYGTIVRYFEANGIDDGGLMVKVGRLIG